MKVGLVLEGGAMRGMYTAGVLDTFLEENIEVDGIIGVSAGVLFGVNYLSKQKGRVIRYNKRFLKEKRYMGMHSFIKTGNIINKDFSFYEVPYKLDVFDDEEYKKSKTDFYATVTNIETGKPEYIKLKSVFDQMEVLRATSAMPYVSKFVELDGKKYLERYKTYNDSVEKIIDLENKKEIFVIRPSKTLKIKRIEKDENKLQEMYDLGIKDCKAKLESLKKYLKS